MNLKSEHTWKGFSILIAMFVILACGDSVASGLVIGDSKAASQGAGKNDRFGNAPNGANSEDMIEVPASCMNGYDQYAVGQYEKAIELYKACIGSGALNAEALGRTYRNIGIAYRGLKQFKTSIQYFDLSLEQKPLDPWSDYINQGNSYSDLGNYEQAMRLYDKAELLNPNMGDIAYNRGIVYERKNDKGAAIDQFVLAYSRGLRSRLLFDKLIQYDLIDNSGLKPGR